MWTVTIQYNGSKTKLTSEFNDLNLANEYVYNLGYVFDSSNEDMTEFLWGDDFSTALITNK